MQPKFLDFEGSGKSRHEYATLSLLKIPQGLRDREAELRESRWFDYRTMTPVEATYCFASEYRKEYIAAYERSRDIRTSERIRPFSPNDIFSSAELTAMVQARQEADSIGCKYDFYLNFAFRRFEHRGWRHLPRPNQVASEELVLDIKDAWATTCGAFLQLAQTDFYTAENYDGLPEQDCYYNWLVGQVKNREHPHMALARLVYEEAIIPEHIAMHAFGDAVMKRAKKLCL